MSSVGLVDLFGLDQWVPTGAITTTQLTQRAFEAMVVNGRMRAGADYATLLAAIPSGLTNQFQFEARSQRGFKFEWRDSQGIAWHAHGHEPDAGAAQGHVGGQTWVARIKYGKAWLLSTPIISNFPSNHKNYAPPAAWSSANSPNVMLRSHIPLDAA